MWTKKGVPGKTMKVPMGEGTQSNTSPPLSLDEREAQLSHVTKKMDPSNPQNNASIMWHFRPMVTLQKSKLSKDSGKST